MGYSPLTHHSMPQLIPDYPGHKPPRWRYLRSFLPVIVLILLFFFLSSYSLLSHSKSPAAKQHIGWQAWDVVDMTSQTEEGDNEEVGNETGNTNGTDTTFIPSIPLDNWDPLAMHSTGLTEITVKSCYFPPEIFPSFCAPETTPELDKTKGKWVIVEKDLNVRSGLWYLNLYYRRTRRLDAKLITDIKVLSHPPENEEQLYEDGWVLAPGDLHNGVWPKQTEMRLWYKLGHQGWDDWRKEGKRREDDHDSAVDGEAESSETESSGDQDQGTSSSGEVQEIDEGSKTATSYGGFINEIDVLYGDDDPFFGFERVQGGPVLKEEKGKWETVDITVRRGNPRPPRATVPIFHSDGTLKIMQIADLHYSVGTGECRDTDLEGCVGDANTAAWIAEALDAENPDLVVFSGDQLNGQRTSYDARSVLAKFAKPVIERKIPWCAVFGNHDSEIYGDRDYQMKTLENMPYSLSRAGPKSVDGVGNYYIKLHSSDASDMHIFTLYFLDSHAYQKRTLPWAKPDYDYLKTSQIEWYRNVSSSIKPIERPFKPDGAEDLSGIWSRRSQASRLPRDGSQTLAKPNAMMWFHIPLPEAYNDPDQSLMGELNVGVQMDIVGSSKHNSGFFYNAIKTTYDSEETEGYFNKKTAEVKVLNHGHCHNTDRCRRVDGIWMCFGGGSSFSGYGQLGFDRRVRVYRISEYGEKVETYKRLTSGEIIDEQVLVGDGAAEGVGQDQI
ncbi:hypothetical protein C345_05305 [Cryptococcus neoformans A2-102-5]|nr:hypothetical protein C346_05410 [Cryptococcus neoformans var. grubii D17-1]OXG92750.1 hypothetical protein C345_05305 [Cryptococcus neoformans var. grubii A2-102-5]